VGASLLANCREAAANSFTLRCQATKRGSIHRTFIGAKSVECPDISGNPRTPKNYRQY
jgi:hypothetical protein